MQNHIIFQTEDYWSLSLGFLYITNVYNLQTVPFKNKLKYKSRKLGTLLQF